MKPPIVMFFLLISFICSAQNKEGRNHDLIKLFEQSLKTVDTRIKDIAFSGVAFLKLSTNKKRKAFVLNEIPENYARHIRHIIAKDSLHILSGYKKNTILPIIFLNLRNDIINDEEVGIIQRQLLISAFEILSKRKKIRLLNPAIIIRPDPSYKRRD